MQLPVIKKERAERERGSSLDRIAAARCETLHRWSARPVGGGMTDGVDRLTEQADPLPFERLPLGALHA
jgi:hypothetical protein